MQSHSADVSLPGSDCSDSMVLPARAKHAACYIPYGQVVGGLFQIIGLAVWGHYAMYCYDKSYEALSTLGRGIASSDLDTLKRAVVATVTVYAAVGVAVGAAHGWRSVLERWQDRNGALSPSSVPHLMLNILLQAAWFVVLMWVTVTLSGAGAFSALVYNTQRTLCSSLEVEEGGKRVWVDGGTSMPVGPSPLVLSEAPSLVYCPVQCVYLYPMPYIDVSNSSSFCVCDREAIRGAVDTLQEAVDASKWMLLGLYFMFFGALVVQASLAVIFGHVRREMDISERLEDLQVDLGLDLDGRESGGAGTESIKSEAGVSQSQVLLLQRAGAGAGAVAGARVAAGMQQQGAAGAQGAVASGGVCHEGAPFDGSRSRRRSRSQLLRPVPLARVVSMSKPWPAAGSGPGSGSGSGSAVLFNSNKHGSSGKSRSMAAVGKGPAAVMIATAPAADKSSRQNHNPMLMVSKSSKSSAPFSGSTVSGQFQSSGGD